MEQPRSICIFYWSCTPVQEKECSQQNILSDWKYLLLNCRNSETGLSLSLDHASGMTYHGIAERESSIVKYSPFQSCISLLKWSSFISCIARCTWSIWNVLHLRRKNYYYYYYCYYYYLYYSVISKHEHMYLHLTARLYKKAFIHFLPASESTFIHNLSSLNR